MMLFSYCWSYNRLIISWNLAMVLILLWLLMFMCVWVHLCVSKKKKKWNYRIHGTDGSHKWSSTTTTTTTTATNIQLPTIYDHRQRRKTHDQLIVNPKSNKQNQAIQEESWVVLYIFCIWSIEIKWKRKRIFGQSSLLLLLLPSTYILSISSLCPSFVSIYSFFSTFFYDKSRIFVIVPVLFHAHNLWMCVRMFLLLFLVIIEIISLCSWFWVFFLP